MVEIQGEQQLVVLGGQLQAAATFLCQLLPDPVAEAERVQVRLDMHGAPRITPTRQVSSGRTANIPRPHNYPLQTLHRHCIILQSTSAVADSSRYITELHSGLFVVLLICT